MIIGRMQHFEEELSRLKEKLLTMASRSTASVTTAMRALLEHDDDLARLVEANDNVIDQLEMEIDETVIQLLAKSPLASDLRLIAVAMKISHDLERVGDEATAIARRCIELIGHFSPGKAALQILDRCERVLSGRA